MNGRSPVRRSARSLYFGRTAVLAKEEVFAVCCTLAEAERLLMSAATYPTDYGYLRGTLGQDGDPLDALVCLYEATFPGCLIPVKPVGMFMMRDEKGIDDKIICVPLADPYWNEYHELEDLPMLLRQEIEQFFSIYKDLEGKTVTIDGWHSRAEAEQEIAAARERLRDS